VREMTAGAPELHGYEQSARHRCFSWMRERRGLRSRAAGRLLLVLSESELTLRQSAAAPVKRERFPGSPSEWLFATGS
jgi:hypothetical protein